MIKTIDLHDRKQENCRVMICQLCSEEYNWQDRSGLLFLQNNARITDKISELLRIAKHHSVDLVIFPELSIPEALIGKIQEWSRNQGTLVVGGSHYYTDNNNHYIQRCPIIIKGDVFFINKLTPSPYEISPIQGEGLTPGKEIIKFTNTFIGNFAVLICADYLNDQIKTQLNLNELDILCVPAYQNKSNIYYNRMQSECETSLQGIYILYSNFLGKKSDGSSAVFGVMDKIFTEKLKASHLSDLQPSNKTLQFSTETEYIISELDLHTKRPFRNRNIGTKPNIKFISSNNQIKSKDLAFIQKVAHDDERYKRIEDLYVPPVEYDEITETLKEKNIVFIIGDPGIGKTYTAVQLLKTYYNQGFEPIWFAGLEKEEREIQSKVLSDYTPCDNQIVYFEDPFGRTVFERRDSLFQIFSPLMDKLATLNSKVIITSRTEIFENFSGESLLEDEILSIKHLLNISKPSYDSQKLREIFDKLASIICEWYDNKEFRNIVYQAIDSNQLTTPLSIRDFIYISKDIKDKSQLITFLKHRQKEVVKTFQFELLQTSYITKLVLNLIFFSGVKGKAFLSTLFIDVCSKLQHRIGSTNYSFNVEIRSQIGYRVEQFGSIASAYKFIHPIYEEAIEQLIRRDKDFNQIAKTTIECLAKIDLKIAYAIINRNINKYPELALLLFQQILGTDVGQINISMRVTLCSKLIVAYYKTKNYEFFEISKQYYTINELVNSLNTSFDGWKNLQQKIHLCILFRNNAPSEFDTSIIHSINWEYIFSHPNDEYLSPNKIINVLDIIHTLKKSTVQTFISSKGNQSILRAYILSNKRERHRLINLIKSTSLESQFYDYESILEKLDNEKLSKTKLIEKVLYSNKKYYGKFIIDQGASMAIRHPWTNLLPIGITKVVGSFSEGTVIGVFNQHNSLIGIGITEYSSAQMEQIKSHHSEEFFELIGYFHSSCAIRNKFLKRFRSKSEASKWTYINESCS
ncbi:PUA domain-containing protein [uncultured Alistipes sp.]|jgi:predicted amidohydrolase/predicted ribosome-associated RNA-binding protein Tma20|uniref:nSTAND3 domain-containing NTPase n=1 Tax=uncultured Alistipes sp. TaxID=538949 RepID=UPI0025F5DE0F|nr:PUA domain-containing protein [uncultured Alistipes sp.]